MASRQLKMDTPVGSVFLVANEKGLEGVHWTEQDVEMVSSSEADRKSRTILQMAAEQLTEYFKGQRKQFNLPLAPNGTDFQKKVWSVLSQIPYGKTFSYSEVALRIANAKAVRAVGSANGKNPLSIIVPCHRVIAADGSLGGYAGGLDKKGKLLQLEKAEVALA